MELGEKDMAGAVTVTVPLPEALIDDPAQADKLHVMTAEPIALPVTVAVPLVKPTPMVSAEGFETTDGIEELQVGVIPPDGAACDNVTVTFVVFPSTTEFPATVMPMSFTTSVALVSPP